jgi:hypothetical protein
MPAPNRPYRNLQEYAAVRYGRSKHLWPCVECCGRGVVRRFEDRDPIEGYKLAPLYKCGSCNGTGKGGRDVIAAEFRELLAKWRRELKAYRELQKLRRSAAKKLTRKEKIAVGLLKK